MRRHGDTRIRGFAIRHLPLASGEAGQGTVELLFVVLILALLFFGAVELGQGVGLKHQLDVGTEKAARQLSINPSDYAAAERTIRAEVDGNFLGGGYGSRVAVSLCDAQTLAFITPADLAAAPFGYRFLVVARLDWQPFVPFMSLDGRTLTSVHQGIVERFP
jgi:Flp pilus assembly protein TadG